VLDKLHDASKSLMTRLVVEFKTLSGAALGLTEIFAYSGILKRGETNMTKAILYEFSLCPFCNKVRAALELKGLQFDRIEVTPGNKKELPELPEGSKRKVPVLQAKGMTVQDSTAILAFIEAEFPGRMSFRPNDDTAHQFAEEIENWIDDQFIQALPTVIYGTWKEASMAARYVAKNSKFGAVKRMGVQLAGSIIMHQIAKRILKRHQRDDAHAWVRENVDQFSQWLGDQPYVTGSELSMADVAMHGALSSVKDFPIFAEVMHDAKIRAWYDSLSALRQENRA